MQKRRFGAIFRSLTSYVKFTKNELGHRTNLNKFKGIEIIQRMFFDYNESSEKSRTERNLGIYKYLEIKQQNFK